MARTTSGLAFFISLRHLLIDRQTASKLRSASGLAPVEKVGPFQERITCDSMSRPESHTTTSCPRLRSSSAAASPGKACPPVPPQATTIFITSPFRLAEAAPFA